MYVVQSACIHSSAPFYWHLGDLLARPQPWLHSSADSKKRRLPLRARSQSQNELRRPKPTHYGRVATYCAYLKICKHAQFRMHETRKFKHHDHDLAVLLTVLLTVDALLYAVPAQQNHYHTTVLLMMVAVMLVAEVCA